MTDIGTTKTMKEGMEQINMRRTEERLTLWFTTRSVISSISAIRKMKVNKIRLMKKGGIISLKTYLSTMLETISKPQIAFEGKAGADDKAQHTR